MIDWVITKLWKPMLTLVTWVSNRYLKKGFFWFTYWLIDWLESSEESITVIDLLVMLYQSVCSQVKLIDDWLVDDWSIDWLIDD